MGNRMLWLQMAGGLDVDKQAPELKRKISIFLIFGGSGNQDQWGNFERFMRYRERKERYETNGRRPIDHFGPEGQFRGEDDVDNRANAGPAPAWNGTTNFQDYMVRAKI